MYVYEDGLSQQFLCIFFHKLATLDSRSSIGTPSRSIIAFGIDSKVRIKGLAIAFTGQLWNITAFHSYLLARTTYLRTSLLVLTEFSVCLQEWVLAAIPKPNRPALILYSHFEVAFVKGELFNHQQPPFIISYFANYLYLC